ncbi:FAD-dependent oxidoreductase [Herbaspirillum robiniae]|uniref:FAD-dependent oxidoreductase n=1 Tax=Herbaspirillum robiniae TaxID=2014887 RepID=UPI003D772807
MKRADLSAARSAEAAPAAQHVIVIGAGVVGVSTALALAEAGHRVEVYEAASEAAQGASFANAGLISPGHCFSWAEPGALGVFVKSLFGKADGLGVTRLMSPSLWRWGWQFWRHSSAAQWERDSRAALALSAYSRDVHFAAARGNGVAPALYGGAERGILYLYQQGQSPRAIEKDMLASAGEPVRQVDAAGLAQIEPLLQQAGQRFEQGVYCPNDGTGNASEYTAAALQRAQALGVHFHFNAPVQRLLVKGDRIAGVELQHSVGVVRADTVVMAAGLASASLLKPLGYDLPIYPVTGYSITFHHEEDFEPAVGAVSLADKIAWAGFGRGVVRFTGFADIGPRGSEALGEKRFAALESFARRIYPQLTHCRPQRWIGQRPMTPDGIPVLGASRHANLLLNCGHGAMGWTMAGGCAQIVCDLVAGRAPAIDCAPYRWNRFS